MIELKQPEHAQLWHNADTLSAALMDERAACLGSLMQVEASLQALHHARELRNYARQDLTDAIDLAQKHVDLLHVAFTISRGTDAETEAAQAMIEHKGHVSALDAQLRAFDASAIADIQEESHRQSALEKDRLRHEYAQADIQAKINECQRLRDAAHTAHGQQEQARVIAAIQAALDDERRASAALDEARSRRIGAQNQIIPTLAPEWYALARETELKYGHFEDTVLVHISQVWYDLVEYMEAHIQEIELGDVLTLVSLKKIPFQMLQRLGTKEDSRAKLQVTRPSWDTMPFEIAHFVAFMTDLENRIVLLKEQHKERETTKRLSE